MKIVSNRNGIKQKKLNIIIHLVDTAHTHTPDQKDRINKIKWWSMYIMISEKCYFGITLYGNDHKAGIRNY